MASRRSRVRTPDNPGAEAAFGVEARPIRLDEPKARSWGKLLLEGGPTRPAPPLDLLPVIHASALQIFVVELEPERLDQVEIGSCGGAEAGYVSCVRRDFRFEQDDVHW